MAIVQGSREGRALTGTVVTARCAREGRTLTGPRAVGHDAAVGLATGSVSALLRANDREHVSVLLRCRHIVAASGGQKEGTDAAREHRC